MNASRQWMEIRLPAAGVVASLMTAMCLTACGPEARPPEREEIGTSQAELNPNAMGVAVGDITDDRMLSAAINQLKALGARWVRFEVLGSRGPDWARRVAQTFRANGIDVVALLDYRTLQDGRRDPGPCNSAPTAWGQDLVARWIRTIDPFVQALKQAGVRDFEIWNEADTNFICPANYAFMLVESRLTWSDIVLGPSILATGLGGAARQYMRDLMASEKVNWYRATHGGNLPWFRVYLHPYYGAGSNNAAEYIPFQRNQIMAEQWAPLWLTEQGTPGDNESTQASQLVAGFNTALSTPSIEKMFWFSLANCDRNLGLLAECLYEDVRPREAYWAYQSLTAGSAAYLPMSFNPRDGRRNLQTGDWANGSFKGEAGRGGERVTGLSVNIPIPHSAHSILSHRGNSDAWRYPRAGCYSRYFGGGDNRGFAGPDWAYGYFKGECRSNEFVAGIAQSGDRKVTHILCCPGSVNHNACGTRTMDRGDDRGNYQSGDWAPGFFKAECAENGYVSGVSRGMGDGAPHSIMCCLP